MPPTRFLSSPHTVRVAAWGGAIALAVATFVMVTRAMLAAQGETTVDQAILLWMAGHRTPSLTGVMVGLTTFGSRTLLIALLLAAFAILIVLRDRWGLLHLAAACIGTWLLTSVTKGIIGRTRPTEVAHLVDVTGYSYPSGHSLATAALFLTIAIDVGRRLHTRAAKVALVAAACILVVMTGVSRVYLGVHYPSDVIGGFSLGTAWALLLAAATSVIAARRQQPHTRQP